MDPSIDKLEWEQMHEYYKITLKHGILSDTATKVWAKTFLGQDFGYSRISKGSSFLWISRPTLLVKFYLSEIFSGCFTDGASIPGARLNYQKYNIFYLLF